MRIVRTRIIMGDTTALIGFLTWLSPAFPVEAFAYSAGLEQAVADRIVTNRQSLLEWLTVVLTYGGGWNDAVLVAESHAACNDRERFREANALVLALASSRERFQETLFRGRRFCPQQRDVSINLAAIADLSKRLPDLDVVFIGSGGDNLGPPSS